MFESLAPEVFDALIVVNIVIGLLVAGRRFLKDIRGPLPADAPEWAQAPHPSAQAKSSPEDL